MLIGYAPVFRPLAASVERPDIGRYTHINLAFANPDPRGLLFDKDRLTCMPQEDRTMIAADRLKSVVEALQAKGIKVSISIGGGVIPGCSGDWRALLAAERRASTVAGLVALVDELGLDGLDVDIEGRLLAEIDQAGDFTPFVAELSAALRQRGKLLSCATASYEGGMIPIPSIPYFDIVNVMSYDPVGPSWGRAGAEHSRFATARRDLVLWRARGVAKDKLVLGVPFYGYGFGGHRTSWSYRDLLPAHGSAAKAADVIGTACAGCAYITFNTPRTLRRKARLAARQGGGVMVWEVSQDSENGDLLAALREGLD